MASSLVLGLAALTGKKDEPNGILFGVSDQPFLTMASLEALVDAFSRQPDRICCLSEGNRRGNPVIFPKALFFELSQLKGDVGGRQVIRRHPELVLSVEAASSGELDDIDERK